MSDTKISDAAVESALSASAGSWQVRDMLACDESEHAEVMGIALTAALPHLHGNTVPAAWFTDDYLEDQSSTTYDEAVADKWRSKGWSVTPLYTHPQPAELADQKVAELTALSARWKAERLAGGSSAKHYTAAMHACATELDKALAATGKQQVGDGSDRYHPAQRLADIEGRIEPSARELEGLHDEQVGEVQGDLKSWIERIEQSVRIGNYTTASSELGEMKAALAARQPGEMSAEASQMARDMVAHCIEHRLCMGMDEGFASFDPDVEHPFVQELRGFVDGARQPGTVE
jgi:hypothetical protein